MKYTLLAIGVIVTGMALRATKKRLFRKLGMICFMLSTSILCYALTQSFILSIASIMLWFMFPWIELLLSIRKLKFPVENKLNSETLPVENYFPEALKIKKQLQDKDFRHITDCGWKWANAHEHYSFFWHEDKKHIIAICHRIQSCITFCYLTITSLSEDGTIWKSSNFPFTTNLPHCPKIQFNHVTEGNISCPSYMIYSHDLFLYEQGQDTKELSSDIAQQIEQFFETEMQSQIDHNLSQGLIYLTGDGHFKYSFKGLFFLWRNILRDMYRLC